MIKATGASKGGRQVAIIGLSDMNLTKLREGLPIHIFGFEFGLDKDIVIFWGPTEESMAAELEKLGAVRDSPTTRQ